MGGRLFFSWYMRQDQSRCLQKTTFWWKSKWPQGEAQSLGSPEWRRAGQKKRDARFCLAKAEGWNSGRKLAAELKLSDRRFSKCESLSGVDSSWKTVQTLIGGWNKWRRLVHLFKTPAGVCLEPKLEVSYYLQLFDWNDLRAWTGSSERGWRLKEQFAQKGKFILSMSTQGELVVYGFKSVKHT